MDLLTLAERTAAQIERAERWERYTHNAFMFMAGMVAGMWVVGLICYA